MARGTECRLQNGLRAVKFCSEHGEPGSMVT